MTSRRSLYLVSSCAQACWRGYRQRRAYLERLHYLKANTEAAVKVWKILSSAFVPMLGIVTCLFSLQVWHLPLPSAEEPAGIVAAGPGQCVSGQGRKKS